MLQRRTDELRKLQSTHERLRGTHTALQAQSDLMQSAPWPSNCGAGVSPAPLPASDGCDVPSTAYVGAQAAEASSLGDLSAEAGGAGLKGLRAVLGQARPSATAPADAGARSLGLGRTRFVNSGRALLPVSSRAQQMCVVILALIHIAAIERLHCNLQVP